MTEEWARHKHSAAAAARRAPLAKRADLEDTAREAKNVLQALSRGHAAIAMARTAAAEIERLQARVQELEADNEALQSHVAMRTEILATAERADTIPRAVLVGSLRKRLRQATAPGGASCSSDMRRDAIAETLRGLIREIERGEWPGEGER